MLSHRGFPLLARVGIRISPVSEGEDERLWLVDGCQQKKISETAIDPDNIVLALDVWGKTSHQRGWAPLEVVKLSKCKRETDSSNPYETNKSRGGYQTTFENHICERKKQR